MAPQKEVYPYPSPYGSHASMVDLAETKKLADPDLVVCKDEFGFYVTCPKRLDNGMADSNRSIWHETRTKIFNDKLNQVFEIVL